MNITSSFTGQFQQRILYTIRNNHLLDGGGDVIVGVSGGPDSVCLLHVLHALSDALCIRLNAIHINHMLRDKEADDDEKYTADLCAHLGVSFAAVRIDVGAMAKERGLSLEEAGREARYREFYRCAEKTGASAIAVAHNKNDQAETVMMHIIRGAGTSGLAGMEYMRGLIIRPLLNVYRQEIERYCSEAGLKPRTDSSNLTEDFTRNRVRLGLFPYINKNFGANIVDSLCRLSANAAEDGHFLAQCAEDAYIASTISKSTGFIEMKAEKLRELDQAVLSRVLKQALRNVSGTDSGIGRAHYGALSELIHRGRTGSRTELPGGITAEISYRTLKISSAGRNGQDGTQTKEFAYMLEIPGTVLLPELGSSVTAVVENHNNIDKYGTLGYNPFVQFFDYGMVGKGINIRNRQTGDIFKPLRSNGTKKLKKYFIDSKIPRERRDSIPLICIDSEVVWVIGYKISDKFKVTENTKSVLKIEYNGGFSS